MDKVLLTPRLRLTLLETAEDGSLDLQEIHTLRSSPEATIWSIAGTSKSPKQTQDFVNGHVLPVPDSQGAEKYRTSYLMHTREENDPEGASKLVGTVGIKECQPYPGGPFPDHVTVSATEIQEKKILKVELGYMVLPQAWGKGYAPEAIAAMLEAFNKARHVWNPPFDSVYFEAIIGPTNPRSQRVAEKVGFKLRGEHVWEGPDTFIGGAMQPPRILVYGYTPQITSGSGEGST